MGTHWIAFYVNGNDIVHFDSLTLYAAVLNICNILFSTLLFSVVKIISLLCVFIPIFELLLVRPHFLNYFFFIFAHVMLRDIFLTQGSRKPRGTFFVLILYQVVSLYGIHFSNFLNSIHGSLHLYSKFYLNTLSR